MNESRKYKWHKIAESETLLPFAENNIAVITIKEKKICITKHNNDLLAFAYKCPHAGGAMSEGYIDALGNIICPVHGYKFNMRNGRNSSGEGYYLKHWPVEKRPDGIYIGLEEDSLFGWLI